MMLALLAVTFAIAPPAPLMDDRLSIRISGLAPNHEVTVRARSRARDGRLWRSAATFTSRPDGSLDLASDAPLSGGYRGVDAMGLFWSMRPDGDAAFFSLPGWNAAVATELEAVGDGRVLASARVERRFARPEVRCAPLTQDRMAGLFCEPGDGRQHPAVIVLGGSEGGFSASDAALLASHGFAALSLAYFGAGGLPPTLQNVPVEYFGAAIRWVLARPGVEPGSLALYGASRGAEAALIAAALFPEVRAVVAKSPPHVAWEGISGRHLPGGPAWTSEGKPLPYVRNRIGIRFAARFAWNILARNPVATTPLFLDSLPGAPAEAEIPVERIRGPVLLISGADDQVWPSAMMARLVLERLHRHAHPYPDKHLSYAGTGHWIPETCLPTAGPRQRMKWAIGGTPEGTAKAHAESWPKILRFLAAR